MLLRQLRQPHPLLEPAQLRRGLFRQCKIVGGVLSPQRRGFPARFQLLLGIFVDRFQHQEAPLAIRPLHVIQQVLVAEGGEPL